MSLSDLFKKALSASTQGNTSGFGHAMTGFSASHFGDIANYFGSPNSSGNSNHSPGTPAFLSADGLVSPIQSASGGGSKSSTGVTTSVVAPTPTLVGSNANGLQIKLIWDTSVGAMGSLMSTFQNAVITAAKFYTNTYSTHETINIQVGFGEVAGQTLPSGALAASESYGYLEKYASVAAALKQDANWSTAQKSADATLPATDPTKGGNFFVTTAEAKALGQVGASSSVDGYIGLSSSYGFSYNQTAQIGKYDAVGAIEHEISEVMGRVGSLGSAFGSNIYTPLDLFRYTSPGVRDLTPGPGYFSVNGGTTNLGTYNNPKVTSGDFADWGPTIRGDSYGYGSTNTVAAVTPNDIIENAALGYRMTAAGLNAAHTTGVATA